MSGSTSKQALGDAGLIDQLLAVAFHTQRDPRSPEYRAGVRAVVAFRIAGTPIRRPYAAGTAQDDAFDAGQVEGHAIWRRAKSGAEGA